MGVDMMRWAEERLPEENRALSEQVEKLKAEREELRRLARNVRDYWRANPGHGKDGISTPGMLLLMAVEK